MANGLDALDQMTPQASTGLDALDTAHLIVRHGKVNPINASPMAGGGTLQIGPLDTGVHVPETLNNALAGMGKSFVDTARGIGQKVGLVSTDDVAKSRVLDAPLMATRAARVGNIAGAVAQAAPLAFVPGANSLAGAAVGGAAYGFAQPSTGAGELASNTVMGGLGGGAGNVVGRAAGAVYGLGKGVVQPFFDRGRQAIINRLIQATETDPAAIQGLAQNAGQIVPGSLPTAAEAAGTVGIARLAKALQQQSPAVGQAFADRTAEQNAARIAAVQTVSGNPAQRAALVAQRGDIANSFYGSARQEGLDPSKLRPDVVKNLEALQARIPASVHDRATDLANISGQPMSDGAALDGLHWTNQALDGEIGAAKVAGDNTRAAFLQSLKADVGKTLENLSPTYANANATFAEMSRPINQIDIGQSLQDKLIPAINDFGGNRSLNANAFAQALRNGDTTAQRALGRPQATLADVLSPAQMDTLGSVGKDLARSSNVTRNAAAAGSDTSQNLVSQNILKQVLGPTGLPTGWAENTLLQSVLRPAQYVGALAEPRLIDQAGQTLLNPEATLRALQSVNPNSRTLADALRRLGTVAGVAALPAEASGNPVQQ